MLGRLVGTEKGERYVPSSLPRTVGHVMLRTDVERLGGAIPYRLKICEEPFFSRAIDVPSPYSVKTPVLF